MAEGINQHKRLAMGHSITGQKLAKGGMIKPSHKGRLHSALGVPQGKPIPAAKLSGALRSTSAHVRAMANFAKNAKGFGKK